MRAAAVLAAAFLLGAQSSDFETGAALFEKGQPRAAIPFFQKAVELNPQDSRAWKALGVAHAATGDYRSAEDPFRRACELNPKLPDACYYHARALYALDRYQPSLEVLKTALRAGENGWKIRLGMAQALEALSEAREAEAEFKKSMSMCRGADPRPGTAYGLFLVRQGRFADAAKPLEEVVKRFPNAADARIHLGRALFEQGKFEAAAAHFEQAIAIDGQSAQAHLLLAKCYVRVGRDREARAHFEAAAALDQATHGER